MPRYVHTGFLLACGCALLAGAPARADELGAAAFTDAGELLRPDDLDRWIFLGTSLGLGYNEDGFDPGSPGAFQVVQLEPRAYQYLKANGRYADGSMFLLSFFATETRLEGEETGFAQGALNAFEIHVIDRGRFEEGRAFYVFGRNDDRAAVVPPGSPCVECHRANGAFDGTFTQFYPVIRDVVSERPAP